MDTDKFEDALVVEPLLTDDQVNDNEVGMDIRLGHEFVEAERPAIDSIDPLEHDRATLEGEYLRHSYIPEDGVFVLHPRQFALASTLEYFRVPGNLCAEVTSRSRWARIGLIIAMAPFVHPGYAGCLTLELQNLGSIPMKLYPGLRIAQIVFSTCTPVSQISPGQRVCAVGPEPPQLVNEKEKRLLLKRRRPDE